jgi:hypothetical protein
VSKIFNYKCHVINTSIIQIKNALIDKIKESSLQAKTAYSIAKDLKEQFNIEDELPLL